MKLVLYSGGQNRQNQILHQELIGLCEKRKRIRFTYIPFCSENSNLFFQRIIRRYRSYGATDFQCLPVDRPLHSNDLNRALKSEIIYLAGGNTFYFLKNLKQQKLLAPLRRFARNGGVLAGLSAGALIITPNIRLAGIPAFDADENDVALKDYRGLGLTRFEFSPHYSASKSRNQSLIQYSKETPHPIYASPDGGGLIINGDRFTSVGNLTVFHKGAKHLLSP